MKLLGLYEGLLFVNLLSFNSNGQAILVKPYIQPGNAGNFSKEEKVLIWQTDSTVGNFIVEYTPGQFAVDSKISKAKISSNTLQLNGSHTKLYRAGLKKLLLGKSYSYRVMLNEKVIAQNTFQSRHKDSNTRFVVFGDLGKGTKEQSAIAQQVWKQKPQFVLVAGDVVYTRGLESEYRNNFFPYYNSVADSEIGAPLMGTIPFYNVVGNHDIYGSDLDKYPDGLAYFYYNDLPLNAPMPKLTVEAGGTPERVQSFKKNTSPRYPGMTNYSFDYGNVHIVCLDANTYVNPLDPGLVEWMRTDVKSSKADWKLVAYHNPAFNASKAHYDDQWMRLLDPLFQELRIDLVLTGHVHNYQRTVPLKFKPKMIEDKTMYLISKEGKVDGEFALDQKYDGLTNTKPDGIIYIVTGAGGAPLYDPELTDNPILWKHEPPENWAPYTVKLISNKHSFTLIETAKGTLTLKQLDSKGETLDSISITK